MLAGSAGGQAVLVLTTPVLTRLYPVAEFGVLTVFTALVGLLAPVAAGRMEAAVPLPRRDSDARCLAVIGLAAALVVATLAGLALLLAGQAIGGLLGVPALARQWAPLAFALAAAGAYQIASAWLVRRRRYQALGVRDFATGSAQAACQVGLGIAGASAVGLTLGFGFGRLAGLLGLAGPARGLELTGPQTGGLAAPRRFSPSRDLRLRDLRRNLVRYRRFPLLASWSALLNTMGTYAPILVIGAGYGELAVALLGLTVRVLSAPSALLSTAVARVYEGEAAAAVRDRRPGVARAIQSAAGRLALLGLGPLVVITLCGPALFRLVFGSSWEAAGDYARILAVGYLARFAVAAVSQTLLILQRQFQQLRWDATRLLLTVGGPLVCLAAGAGVTTAVAVLSGTYVVTYAALLVSCLRAARTFDATVARRGRRIPTDARMVRP